MGRDSGEDWEVEFGEAVEVGREVCLFQALNYDICEGWTDYKDFLSSSLNVYI